MSREVRMVPPWWHHPVYFNDFRKEFREIPLMDGFNENLESWERERVELERRLQECNDPTSSIPDTCRSYVRHDLSQSLNWHSGDKPDPRKYMPDFPEELRTHYQMYETCSEGTPISPVLATAEELARWLADNKASAFADSTASYNEWLRMIKGPGWAPSCVSISGQGVVSGVAAGV